MDYKKKYEEAERLYQTANADQRYVLESFFPELKESEDEKIKHEIKVVLANTDLSQFALEYTFADMLAWLEKQGEQKSQRIISAEAKEAMYNKPAWSEEDEVLLSSVINSLLIFEDSGASKMKIDWLKHIRKRIKGE